MLTRNVLPILMTGALAFSGCSKPNTTKTTTETETKQVGSTSETTTQTKVDTPSGDVKALTNSYVGTVTQFKPGKSIEVMTGNKDTHSFDLDGKNDIVTIDPTTAVGSKITLVEEKGDKGYHRITVTIAPPA